MEKTYTEIGIMFGNLRIAVRIPKMKKPKFFRGKVKRECFDEGSWRDELMRRYNKVNTKPSSSSSSLATSSSTSSTGLIDDDAQWIRDFHERYNPVHMTAKQPAVETETLLSGAPAHTSTPVNLKIRPLNRIGQQSPENPDMTGVKIYEGLNYSVLEKSAELSGMKIYENLEDGIRDILGSEHQLNNSYEIVSVDNRVIAKAHFRPRTVEKDYEDYRTLERKYRSMEKDYMKLEREYKTLERVFKPRTLKFAN